MVSYLYDGTESFKSAQAANKYSETVEQDEQVRLNDFGKWLEKDE